MTNIAVVNTKGGVGKTTTSIYMAAFASYRGRKVRVVDADPQGTASAWITYVNESSENEVKCELLVANLTTLSSLPDDGINFIDTPPGNSSVIDRAVAVADFVVIPTAPSLTDLHRVWDTRSIIPSGTPSAVLLTQVNVQALLTTQTREVLESEDVLVFPTAIPRREKFRQSFGTWPADDAREFVGYGKAFTQIMEGLGE